MVSLAELYERFKIIGFMIGFPKYNYGDKVIVTFDGDEYVGTIKIIDKHGTFFDESDVCYDVLLNNFGGHEQCLVKHINERSVRKYEG